MADTTTKRIKERNKSLHRIITDVLMSTPEFVNNPDGAEKIAVKYLKELWLPLVRVGVRRKDEPYQDYLTRKANVKNFGREIAEDFGEQFGLSEKSTKRIYGIIAGAAKLARDKEIEIPTTRLVDRGGVTVDAGGHVNTADNIYRSNISGKIEDPFGIKGSAIRGEVETSLRNGTLSLDQARIGAEAPLFGGTLSGEVRGNLDEQRARLGYTLPLSKGGKVTKKRKKSKNKKYAKGCVVRAAKY